MGGCRGDGRRSDGKSVRYRTQFYFIGGQQLQLQKQDKTLVRQVLQVRHARLLFHLRVIDCDVWS